MAQVLTGFSSISTEDVRRAEDRLRVRRTRQNHSGWLRRLLLAWLLVGPGILVMLGDNDAGGVLTYATTGAQFGLGFFLPFLLFLMTPLAYVVQEMTVRLGAVTGRGHAELIWARFGRFWGWFSLTDLALGNLLTLVTEFIGMGTGLAFFGVPLQIGVPLSAAVVLGVAIFGRYWTAERLTLGLAGFNLVFVPVALLAHPDPIQVTKAFVSFSLPGGLTGAALFLIIANIGTTIAPWMLFFQQSAVVDKGLTEQDIPHGRLDTAIGSIVMGIIAVAIVIATGATLHPAGKNVSDLSQADFIRALVPFVGGTGARLFALGLFEAGLVAAITINLSTSWAFGEVFGWAHSLNSRIHEAPWFYLLYIVSIVIAAAIVLVPGAPLELITLMVQLVATLLMPPALLFLLLLLNDRELMGKWTNGRWANCFSALIIIALLGLNAAYGLTVLFPHLLPS
jgi:Mn2+/Fe2+ NRAMP family transporter